MAWLLTDAYTAAIPPAAAPGMAHTRPDVTSPPGGWLGPLQGTADAAQNAVTGAAQAAGGWLQGQADALQKQAQDVASGAAVSNEFQAAIAPFKDSLLANIKTGGWNIVAALVIVAGVWLILED